MSRANNILRNSDIKIDGKVSLKLSSKGDIFNLNTSLIEEREIIEKQILDAKKEYEKIIIETEKQRQAILEDTNVKVKAIEKKAYEAGYDQGLKNGYEDGYKESYEANIEKAIKESEAIKEEGYNTLLNIKEEANNYIKYNKEKILEISIEIAEQVLRSKFEDKDSMNSLLENVIREYSLRDDLIIKVNQLYVEELQKGINNITGKLDLSQKIFIVSDSNIEKGNAEIETKSGKLIVGIDSVLDKVKAELL